MYGSMFYIFLFNFVNYVFLLLCLLFIMYFPLCAFCVLFVCNCVLYHCHWVPTKLQITNISYHISYLSGASKVNCLDHEVWENMLHRNVGLHWRIDTASYYRRLRFLAAPLWKDLISVRHRLPGDNLKLQIISKREPKLLLELPTKIKCFKICINILQCSSMW